MDYRILLLKSHEEIFEALYHFDNFFSPSLSDTVPDLNVYAGKLCMFSDVYVAKEAAFLGLLVFYANDTNAKIAYLAQLAVQPSARSKGIGKRLLDLCISESKRKGMKEIRLEVQNNNINAIHFYENNGFVFDGVASVKSSFMDKIL